MAKTKTRKTCKSQSDIAARVARNNPKRGLHGEAIDFIENNPGIWRMFCQLARQDIKAGIKRLSASYYFEYIRRNAPRRAGHGYMLKNAFRAYFARHFMALYPKARGLFRTAKVKG